MQDEPILIDRLEDQIIDHPDAKTKKEINESNLDEAFQKRLNERAEQFANTTNSQQGNSNNNKSNGSINGSNGTNTLGMQFLVTKTHLDYQYKDYGGLDQEINEWFAFNDFAVLGGLKYLASYNNMTKPFKEIVDSIALQNSIDDEQLKILLDPLLYYSLGSYEGLLNVDEQLRNIIKYNKQFFDLGLLDWIIRSIKSFINERIEIDNMVSDNDSDSDSEQDDDHDDVSYTSAQNYFKLLTIFYFVINVFVTSEAKYDTQYIKFRDLLLSSNILSSILEFIEHWKWKAYSCYRIRYLIMITWKLILVEFGDSRHLKKVDDFLINLHNIKNKRGKDIPSSKLTCSPLDYFTFREDLVDKYPLFYNEKNNDDNNDDKKVSPFHLEDLKKSLPNESDSDTSSITSMDDNYQYFMAMNNNSNSLSNLLEIPRSNKSHTILSQLPVQTIHISTPAPSPPSTPSDYMTGGEKIRRLYHVNQGMPLIYPHTGDDSDIQVPYAIKEAKEILENSVYESYSIKRLWTERQKFMIQERGYISEYIEEENKDDYIPKNYHNSKDNHPSENPKTNETYLNEFEYDKRLMELFPESIEEIKSILRVESLYKENLARFNSIIQVLIETIKSNKFDYNLNSAEMELNPETSCINKMMNEQEDKSAKESASKKIEFVILQQLEVQKIKEITLKASSSIMIHLLKWFKINHVLKYYYLTSILFDQQYFSVLIEFLSKSFNNSNLQVSKNGENDTNIESFTEYEILTSQNKIMNPLIDIPNFEFFNLCLGKKVDNTKFVLINQTPISKVPNEIDENNFNHITIKEFNENYCFILANLLSITNKILIKNITQRTFILNELKPSEFFKIILMNYDNEHFKTPILKILKKLIPYQGRKWKSVNMDLISSIYLNLKLTLKDNWLSGKDLENDFNNSFDQEIALRSLLQFYNIRKYPQQMELLGYRLSTDEIPILDLNNEDWY